MWDSPPSSLFHSLFFTTSNQGFGAVLFCGGSGNFFPGAGSGFSAHKLLLLFSTVNQVPTITCNTCIYCIYSFHLVFYSTVEKISTEVLYRTIYTICVNYSAKIEAWVRAGPKWRLRLRQIPRLRNPAQTGHPETYDGEITAAYSIYCMASEARENGRDYSRDKAIKVNTVVDIYRR